MKPEDQLLDRLFAAAARQKRHGEDMLPPGLTSAIAKLWCRELPTVPSLLGLWASLSFRAAMACALLAIFSISANLLWVPSVIARNERTVTDLNLLLSIP